MKNKIFTKIILVVVSVSVLIGALVLPSFADETDDFFTTGEDALNNNLGVQVSFPVGYLSVEGVTSDTGASSGRAPTNISLFNYAGSGTSNSWTYTYPDNTTNTFYHSFLTSHLYTVNSLPSGFYGFYNTGYIDFRSSNAGINSSYRYVRLSSLTLSNAIFISSGYNWFDIQFDHLYNQLLDPTLIDLSYTITCTYFKESEDGLLTYISDPINTQCQWNGDLGRYYYRIPFLPNEVLQSDNKVYVQNLQIDFMLSNQHPLDVYNLHYENRISVPTKDTYKHYVDVMLGYAWSHGYYDGLDRGYNDGLNEGLERGFEAGEEHGYILGYDVGVLEGYDEGYNAGFTAGGVSPFESIVNAITSFLSWQFIPGVSFGLVLSLIVGASLLILFLKIFAGG